MQRAIAESEIVVLSSVIWDYRNFKEGLGCDASCYSGMIRELEDVWEAELVPMLREELSEAPRAVPRPAAASDDGGGAAPRPSVTRGASRITATLVWRPTRQRTRGTRR